MSINDLKEERWIYEAIKYSVHLKDTTVQLKDAWLLLFSETIAVFCENHMKHTKTHCRQNQALNSSSK
jgi:hypothetical protein